MIWVAIASVFLLGLVVSGLCLSNTHRGPRRCGFNVFTDKQPRR